MLSFTAQISAYSTSRGKRSKRNTEHSNQANEGNHCIITEADSRLRMLNPGDVERAVVGAELAAKFATNVTFRQQMHRDDDEPWSPVIAPRDQPTLLVSWLPRPRKETESRSSCALDRPCRGQE